MNVRYIYLDRQYEEIRSEVLPAIDDIMRRGAFILRPEVDQLEEKLSSFLCLSHSVGVNSGTDALYLGVRSLQLEKGSEIIAPSHTYISTVAAIIHSGLVPILVDVRDDFNIDPEQIVHAITDKTRAIMVTHMNGRLCDMDLIVKIAREYDLKLVEDAAQAIGATYAGKHPGTFGEWGAFSLHPMKMLGCAGDGGFLSTDSKVISDRIKMMRNMGQRIKGIHESIEFNSRLDTLQAAICLIKIKKLSSWIERRQQLAARYSKAFAATPELITPPMGDAKHHDVFSSYVLRAKKRDELKDFLSVNNIETMISWETPLHKTKELGLGEFDLPTTDNLMQEVLSLPISPEMTDDEQRFVIQKITEFYGYK